MGRGWGGGIPTDHSAAEGKCCGDNQLSSPEPTTNMTVQGGVDVVELTKH